MPFLDSPEERESTLKLYDLYNSKSRIKFSFMALIMHTPDPFTELHCVRHRGTQQDDANMFWQHDEHFLPHHSSLRNNNSICDLNAVKRKAKLN